MGKIIGIDFGATNSCVAVVDGGKPVVVPNFYGQRTTPSIVAFTDNGHLVGQPALDQVDRTIGTRIRSSRGHLIIR